MNSKKPKIIQEIHIKGAKTNNLRNIELKIPKNTLVVVTGVSGSGKSSLVMDTLYAEGQRRYVESMSSYARQFLGRMKKPEVDFIKGISPAIAIEQKVSSSNARSTVGSMTEVYDYLRLLFARAGVTLSPISGEVVKRQEVNDVMIGIKKLKAGTKLLLLIPLIPYDIARNTKKELELFLQKGYTRILLYSEVQYIEDILSSEASFLDEEIGKHSDKMSILIDRFVVNEEDENLKRIADSVNTAFFEGQGELLIQIVGGKELPFNNRFELDGITFLDPTPQLFNYNNPFGACKKCEGYGMTLGIDHAKVVPNDNLSIYEGAVACWKGEKNGRWRDRFIYNVGEGFPIHKPYGDLSKKERNIVWKGNSTASGIYSFFSTLESQAYKIQNRVLIARYRGKTICDECEGARLRLEASYVKIDNKTIGDLIHLPIDQLKVFIDNISLSKYQEQISKRILLEVRNRLTVMNDIGLSYLTLDRQAATLSGGETQRINLTRTLGSNLTSSLYILDEPSIGLHPKDTEKLVEVLKKLRDLGNTVVVVEHEEDVIRNADFLVDVGPNAGIHGGEIVYAGDYKKLKSAKAKSLTYKYLAGTLSVPVPAQRRKVVNKIDVKNATQHNLKGIDVTFPLQAITVVSGVSGSGKTSLIKHVLHPALLRALQISHPSKIGAHDEITGDIKMLDGVELINQKPIGRSSRSNPVTYVKAYDEIRKLMVKQQLSKIRGYKPKHFSFNTEGGRCDNCQGDGQITIEMQFLADVQLVCEDCNGKRFKPEVLEVQYAGKNIFEILNMSIEESLTFFAKVPKITEKLKPLNDVGLGYVKLGQASSTLSGGEAQRVKLASFLGNNRPSAGHQLFIFDEPTTGLHFDDINKLLFAFQALVEQGNTVVIVEHNLEVIKTADWLIDLGPEGGINGGNLLFQGTPEDLIKSKKSITAHYLKDKLKS
ncbi:MAG: excinuclease ABC subunit A [Saprospiraceae bacterium]